MCYERDPHDVVAPAAARDRVSWCDALARLASSGLDALDGAPPGERFQVVVHVDGDSRVEPRMHLGPVLPKALADHVTCDATIRTVIERLGRPVRFGRRRRTVPPFLRVLIEDRDGGCRVPGCARQRWLHVHHLVHWKHGGPTDPDNLIALCPTHHRMLHLERLHIRGDPDDPAGLVFTDRGRALDPARAHPPGCPPVPAARELGLDTSPYRNPPGERLDSWGVVWN